MPRVRPRTFPASVAARIPLVAPLARAVARVASVRAGRVPVGLLALLPAALLLDALDAADELVLGPVGVLVSFALETAFVLGVTGRPGYALGFAGIDLVPGLDVIPFATLTLLKAVAEAWARAGEAPPGAAGLPAEA